MTLGAFRHDDDLAGPTDEILGARVTKEQLARIRELSQAVTGNPDRILAAVGEPATRGEASLILGAIHCIRSRHKALPGRQTELVASIRTLIDNKELPMETKTCTSCDTDKPLHQYRLKGRGRSKVCTACEDAAKVEVPVSRKAERPAASKPIAEMKFDLSDLRKLQEITDASDLEHAASIAVELVAAFGPKGVGE